MYESSSVRTGSPPTPHPLPWSGDVTGFCDPFFFNVINSAIYWPTHATEVADYSGTVQGPVTDNLS